MQQEKLLRAIEIMAAAYSNGVSSEIAIRDLESQGYTKTEATMLTELVPEAFAAPVLEEMGVPTIPQAVSAKTRKGRWVTVFVGDHPIFKQALELARELRRTGTLSQDVYKTIVSTSTLMGTVSKAQCAGLKISQGKVAIALIGTKAEDLGYRPWYSRLRNTGRA